ncbi:hypothetical protein Pyrfu_1729 [Pyrolobus fumarii 1A]|uniref:Uncharacterized protein n=1 Tax=Pyrolobus fumarii (strain DSM 11204 / 1A) TaxID=694429 RepID=G0ECL4_PYRF1|nr:hypothetical protein [Pyrolobus fumarii]AEM39584.1 hypothetical protein Pyrfu_1729 [Pyrolobus fumarii 1A]
MVAGDMKIYALENVQGDIVYTTTVAPLRLGGLSNPNIGSLSLSLPTPTNIQVKRVLLEIGMVTREYPERMRWRLWFDGIAVSREYRPKSIAQLGDDEGYYSKTVFDVTPIYKGDSDVHKVTIAYEGSNPITVEHVGLFAVYDVPDSVVSFAFLSGALALNPGESYTLSINMRDIPEDATHASVRAVLALTQRDSMVRISVNGSKDRSITGFVGVEEVNLDTIPVTGAYRISFEHVKGSRPVRISTLIVSVARRTLPDIHIESVERTGEELTVRLVNRGATKPERVMLLAIVPGEHIERLEVEPLDSGESTEVKVKAPSDKRVTLRVVWVKHGKPYQREIRV